MVQTVEVNGQIHEFPDEATPQMIAGVLGVQYNEKSPASPSPEQEAPVESNSLIQDLAPAVKTISHIPQNLAVGVGNLGQDIGDNAIAPAGKAIINGVGSLFGKSDTWEALKHYAQKKTGITLPNKISMEEQFGVNDENRQPLTQEIGRTAPELAMTALVPPLRAAKVVPPSLSRFLPKSNIGKGLLNYGTDIAQNAALMGGLNAAEGKSAGEGALAGGVTTAAVNPMIQSFMSGNPLVRIGGAGALGLLGTYGAQKALGTDSTTADLVGAGVGAALGLRGRNARDLAIMNLLKDVDLNRAMPRIQAAKRLGIDISPAEAMNSGYIGGIQGQVGKHPEVALFLEQKGEARQLQEKNAINKFAKEIFDEQKLSPQIGQLYKKSYQSSVTPQFLDNLKKSEVVKTAMDRVNKNPVYKDKLNGVPENSFAYLDQVKRSLDDMSSEAANSGKYAEADYITQTKNNMLKRMDTINKSYKQARNLAQRQIVKDKLMESVNTEELRGTTLFRAALRNDEKFDELLAGLKNVPGGQRQAKDARDVFRVLIDTNVKTPRSGVKLAQTSMESPRSTYQAFLHKLQGKEYDKAMAELMTDPKWHLQVQKAKNMAEPNEKARYVANLISRITGQKISEIFS